MDPLTIMALVSSAGGGILQGINAGKDRRQSAQQFQQQLALSREQLEQNKINSQQDLLANLFGQAGTLTSAAMQDENTRKQIKASVLNEILGGMQGFDSTRAGTYGNMMSTLAGSYR